MGSACHRRVDERITMNGTRVPFGSPRRRALPEMKTAQNRLVYSLLKPAVAMAARFHVPMRTLAELLRLSYFEVLRREGLSQAAVGERLGQTARHMRTLARKLKSDFFDAETEIG